jgi:glycosyltransferase involved in cell wall biosynthesis
MRPTLKRIAIDLTPLRPGGENGGAKTLTWQLLTNFKALTSDYHFLLLTAEWNHDELAVFDGPGFSRLCVLTGNQHQPSTPPRNQRPQDEIYQSIRRQLPLSLINRLRPAVQWVKQKGRSQNRPSSPLSTTNLNLTDQGIDLLFCPFTAVTYAESGLPVVSFVHDLQHRVYPQFFDAAESAGRESTYAAAAHRADYFICNSEYTRQSLLAQYDTIAPEQTAVIPIAVHGRLEKLHNDRPLRYPNPFLFYPANFWPHKNHRMLLTAYNTLRHKRPQLKLDLVFTGAPSKEVEQLKSAAARMNLSDHIYFLDFLSDLALSAVYQSCWAVIYPSLYEGFGIPLLEAFFFNKPLLCSNVTSLPEVAGDAAVYFNPRKPAEIIQAIETLLDDPTLEEGLTAKGQKRLAQYDPAQMVQQYKACFEQVISQKPDVPEAIHGRYEDSWLGPQATFTHRPSNDRRRLTLTLFTPPWHPHPAVILTYRHPESKKSLTTTINRGQTTTLTIPLPVEGGRLTLSFSPTFQPSEHEGTADTRHLSCILQEWRIEA